MSSWVIGCGADDDEPTAPPAPVATRVAFGPDAPVFAPFRAARTAGELDAVIARWDRGAPRVFARSNGCDPAGVPRLATFERGQLDDDPAAEAIVHVAAVGEGGACEGHWIGWFDDVDRSPRMLRSETQPYGEACGAYAPKLDVEWVSDGSGAVLVRREFARCGAYVEGAAHRRKVRFDHDDEVLVRERFAHSSGMSPILEDVGGRCDDPTGQHVCGANLVCERGACAPASCEATAECAFGEHCVGGRCSAGCRRNGAHDASNGCLEGHACAFVDDDHEARGVGACTAPAIAALTPVP